MKFPVFIRVWLRRLSMPLAVFLIFGLPIGLNLGLNYQRDEMIAHWPEPIHPVHEWVIAPQTWQQKLPAIGFIEPHQSVQLQTEVTGVVKAVAFKDGQAVEKGQVLFELTGQSIQAQLKAKQVALPASQAKYERLQRLQRQGSASKQALEEAQATYLANKASLEQLQAQLAQRTILAPFSGMVGLSAVNVGQYVKVGEVLVRLEDPRVMEIRFTVPQTELAHIHQKQAIEVHVDAYSDQTFVGEIQAIEPAVYQESGLVEILASIPNHNQKLLHGMFAKVNVLLDATADQVFVPESAVQYSLYGNSVYVLKELEGAWRVHQTYIELGGHQGKLVQVLSGLAPGDRVVSHGLVRLSHLSRVRLVENALKTSAVMPKL